MEWGAGKVTRLLEGLILESVSQGTERERPWDARAAAGLPTAGSEDVG